MTISDYHRINGTNQLSRRKFAKTIASITLAMVSAPTFLYPDPAKTIRSRMGVAAASYANRWRAGTVSSKVPGFENALQMLVHCQTIGAGGVQVGSRGWSSDFSGKVREFRENHGLYLEGSIQLPKNESELERFATEAKFSKEAGASILRTVCLNGRRYEDFDSGQAFEEFRINSIKSIERVEPILAKNKLKLAIENHKDWLVPELLSLLTHFDSEWIGVNLDTGNNISFLDDPMYVVESLAPYSFTTHLKDMQVDEHQEGFIMSEVPLGSGLLDLKEIIRLCLKYNPKIVFNLEMITRNPLKIPCLNEEYWATFGDMPATKLASTLRWVKNNKSNAALPSVEGQTTEQKLIYEEQNILDSFLFANKYLDLTY